MALFGIGVGALVLMWLFSGSLHPLSALTVLAPGLFFAAKDFRTYETDSKAYPSKVRAYMEAKKEYERMEAELPSRIANALNENPISADELKVAQDALDQRTLAGDWWREVSYDLRRKLNLEPECRSVVAEKIKAGKYITSYEIQLLGALAPRLPVIHQVWVRGFYVGYADDHDDGYDNNGVDDDDGNLDSVIYPADFLAIDRTHEAPWVIEVDGAFHEHEEQVAKDEIRQRSLNKRGVGVIRVTNDEVKHALGWVVENILDVVSTDPQAHGPVIEERLATNGGSGNPGNARATKLGSDEIAVWMAAPTRARKSPEEAVAEALASLDTLLAEAGRNNAPTPEPHNAGKGYQKEESLSQAIAAEKQVTFRDRGNEVEGEDGRWND